MYNVIPGVKGGRPARGVEFYYISIYNNSGRNYKLSVQYRVIKNSG